VYRPVPRSEIIDALIHIRDLHRRMKPSNEYAFRAQERREASIRDLLSNLPRTNEHPTLKSLLEIVETCGLTLEGAHRLFGYSLDRLRELDLQLNSGRTHIIESHPFERDFVIDLPQRLAPQGSFSGDALLRDLVPEWQTDLPIKTLEGDDWSQPGAFYVHVGTEDSLGSSIPPGAMALVEPIDQDEALRPNPRRIYLLQFGNGYRCSHCVATGGKLQLFSSGRTYLGREEFLYPGSVRIAGRIRMFAIQLPVPELPFLRILPASQQHADLTLPWEHRSRDRLLATKHRRFRRPKEQEQVIRDVLKTELQAKLSGRSERRYRGPTSSEPHVNALLHLTVAHAARYTDALRAGGSLRSDRGRFSLEALLKARRLEDLLVQPHGAFPPIPTNVWEGLRREFVEWPPLLSMKFPQLQQWDERIVRLAEGCLIGGLDPSIRPGSWLLLEKTSAIPDTRSEAIKTGWSRPLYTLRRGMKYFCGYLRREGNQFALFSDTSGSTKIAFSTDEMSSLSQVAGIAVPV
jgi:hypothetical protein